MSARDLVEQHLELGEPIEAFLRVASEGPDVTAVVNFASVATLGTQSVAKAALGRSFALAVTDRRVFLASVDGSGHVRDFPKKSVRVLELDKRGPFLRIWLNVEGHQVGFRVPKSLRGATDALVHSLGGAPPARTFTEDR